MKRIFVLIAVCLWTVGLVFAEEKVLIDFSLLVPDILMDQDNIIPQNRQTTIDFSNTAGNSFTQEQKQVMKSSLAIPNWFVELSSSSRTVTNDVLSYTKVVPSKQFENVMGVRIHFPVSYYNSWALIKPPFDIPAYDFDSADEQGIVTAPAEQPNFNTTASRFENGYGVVKNVGAVKSLQVQVYGLNFPHSLSALFVDGNGKTQTVFLGYLNFDGWAKLAWDNPQYISEVRARSLRIYPLYPTYSPYLRFAGFLIQRDGASDGGDFVAYFKDVQIVYDKAELETDKDIDDESSWNIITEREADRQKRERKDFGKDQVFRYLESQKKAPESNFSDGNRTDANTGANQ